MLYLEEVCCPACLLRAAGRADRRQTLNPGFSPQGEGVLTRRLMTLAEARPAEGLLHATVPPSVRVGRPRQIDPCRHIADCHEFAFAVEGKARIVTPAETFALVPGQLLLVDPRVDHREEVVAPSDGYTLCWCGAYGNLVRLGDTTHTPPSCYRTDPTVLLRGRSDVESIMKAVAAEMNQQDWGWVESVNGLLRYLGAILIRRLRRGNALRLPGSESPTISPDPHPWRVIHAALEFCDTNYQHALRVADVAAVTGYSPSHLSRLFSTYLGRSLSGYVRDRRLNAAKHLLEHTHRPVSEIARVVGYSDHSHFTRAFIRATGRSPRAYRNTLASD
jgi:AraC family transcriptional regulator